LISNIEGNSKRPVEVYEQWFKEGKEKADEDSVSTNDKDKESDVRIFKVRSKVNLADIFSGRLPEKVDEIAIDRMHADNRGIKIGDTLKVADQKFTVVGLVSNPDYTTLHRKNTDIMFDAISFDVALVSDEGFDRITARHIIIMLLGIMIMDWFVQRTR
jgi:putative ABC transport system permease protein